MFWLNLLKHVHCTAYNIVFLLPSVLTRCELDRSIYIVGSSVKLLCNPLPDLQKQYLVTSPTRVNRVSQIHHPTILKKKWPNAPSLAQPRLSTSNPLPPPSLSLSSSWRLQFSSSPYSLSFSKQRTNIARLQVPGQCCRGTVRFETGPTTRTLDLLVTHDYRLERSWLAIAMKTQ